MDDLTFFTEEDKNTVAYATCIGATTLGGIAVGRFVGVPGVLAGAAVGLAYGLLSCKHLREPIKRKLFSASAPLSQMELTEALRAVRTQAPGISKREALQHLADARIEISRNSSKYIRHINAC